MYFILLDQVCNYMYGLDICYSSNLGSNVVAQDMAEAAETSFDSVLVDSSNNLIATTIPSNSTARIQMPRIVTPLVEKKLTTSEFNTLQEALNTQKIAEITKAVLSIESLTGDIKKSMFPVWYTIFTTHAFALLTDKFPGSVDVVSST